MTPASPTPYFARTRTDPPTPTQRWGAQLHLLSFDEWAAGRLPYPFTFMLVFLNILLFAVSAYCSAIVADLVSPGNRIRFSVDTRTLLLFGGAMAHSVRSGEVWRLVMAGFLHIGPVHLVVNCLGLLCLGPQVERSFGSARTFSIYLISTIAGFLGALYFHALYFHSVQMIVGASVGIAGLLGAFLVTDLRNTKTFTPLEWSMLLLLSVASEWIVRQFILIGTAGHIGGFLSGATVAWLCTIRTGGIATSRLWNVVTTGSVAALVASLGLGPIRLVIRVLWRQHFH